MSATAGSRVGFSEGVEARQAELRERVPRRRGGGRAGAVVGGRAGRGARAGQLPCCAASTSASRSTSRRPTGVVEVGLGVLREQVLEALEPYADDPLCFDGLLETRGDPRGPPARRRRGLAAARRRPFGVSRTAPASPRTTSSTRGSGPTPGSPPNDRRSTSPPTWWSGSARSTAAGATSGWTGWWWTPLDGSCTASSSCPGRPGTARTTPTRTSFVVALERSGLPAGRFAIQLRRRGPAGWRAGGADARGPRICGRRARWRPTTRSDPIRI